MRKTRRVPVSWWQDIGEAKPYFRSRIGRDYEIKTHLQCKTADMVQYECLQSEQCRQERREGVLTRYRIYRNSAAETTYIATHDCKSRQDPQEFANLNGALAILREGGIPEYEICRVIKELAAINGAIIQVAEALVFDCKVTAREDTSVADSIVSRD